MGKADDAIHKHLAEKEEIIMREYVDVLRKCGEDLERLDKETSYFPVVEITESGTPGRWGQEAFNRGWSIFPRKWEDENIEKIKAKLEEYTQLVTKYSTRITELQEIIAKQNENRR